MEELRIVLLGKQGAGKSSAGNTLLGEKPFHTAASSQRVTKYFSMSTSTVDRHRICVFDTPGWTDFGLMDDKIIQEIAELFALSDPGPHVFLLVLPIGRFTKEEIYTAQQILEVIGEEAGRYTIVLFTKGDDLEEKTIEQYLEGVHPDLKKILEVCGGTYHVFNNRDNENHKQVTDLLQKIKILVKRNKGKHYTKDMYQKMAEKIKEKCKYLKISNTMLEECLKQLSNTTAESNDETMNKNGLDQQNGADTEGTKSAKREDLQVEENQWMMVEQNSHKQPRSCAGNLENHSKKSTEMEWMQAEVQRLMKLEMETWLKEKGEFKKEIQQLQNNVEFIMSVLELEQAKAFDEMKNNVMKKEKCSM